MRKADRERKISSAERLFDAIGMIDDRLIAEAAECHSQNLTQKKIPFMRRYAVSLTALLLVFMMVGGFTIANLSTVLDSDSNSLDEGIRDDIGEIGQNGNTLDFVLSSAVQKSDATTVSLEEIDFFDGEVSIIWSYAGDGENEYHKLTFEAQNAESKVKNCMSKSVEQIPAESEDSNICRVWVSYGNGEVVSPYLKESAGNIGYATLFEYSPEVVPSDSFCDLVSNALNN